MPETGPHVTLAVLCERALVEADGVLSIIRIVDRLTQTATGESPPEQMPPFIVSDIRMVIALKPDRARGRFSLKLVMEDPSGTRIPLGENDVTLQSGNNGVNVMSPVQFVIQHEGVYWVDVLLGGPRQQEDELMTRVPFEVVYQRQRVPTSPPSEE
jgi:hypothetical protein